MTASDIWLIGLVLVERAAREALLELVVTRASSSRRPCPWLPTVSWSTDCESMKADLACGSESATLNILRQRSSPVISRVLVDLPDAHLVAGREARRVARVVCSRQPPLFSRSCHCWNCSARGLPRERASLRVHIKPAPQPAVVEAEHRLHGLVSEQALAKGLRLVTLRPWQHDRVQQRVQAVRQRHERRFATRAAGAAGAARAAATREPCLHRAKGRVGTRRRRCARGAR